MRLIDADNITAVFANVADHLAKEGEDAMASMFRCAIGYVNVQPTVDADAYFDAVDRIKPCPNCRYFNLSVLVNAEIEKEIERGELAEVVRCKDCKYFAKNEGVFSDSPTGHCFYLHENVLPRDFCNYGEKQGKDKNVPTNKEVNK